MLSKMNSDSFYPAISIETAIRPGSVALGISDTRILWKWFPEKEDQASLLFTYLDSLLREGGIKKEELKLIVVGRGPGSFTGVRAGIAAASTIAKYGGIKIVGLCSLYGSSVIGKSRYTAFCMDALRGDVQGCIFENENCIWGPKLCAPRTFVKALPKTGIMAGSGVEILEGLSVFPKEWVKADPEANIPRADNLLKFGIKMALDGDFGDPEKISPFYLRAPSVTEKKR